MAEFLLIERQQVRTLLKKTHRQNQQIIEIHRVRLTFPRDVALPNCLDLLDPMVKPLVLACHHPIEAHPRVLNQAENRRQHICPWKPPLFGVDLAGRHHLRQHRPLIVAIQNRERSGVADVFRMTPQNPTANRMKRAGPQVGGVLWNELAHPLHHFPRRLVRKCQQQNLARLDPVIEQPRHSIRQRPGFSRTRTGNDQRLARRRTNRLVLLRI